MSVVFRFQFDTQRTEEAITLLDIYKDKWRQLMRYIFSLHRDKTTYRRITRLREELDRQFELDQVINMVSEKDDKAARLLVDSTVLFNKAPYDFRIYILAVLGCTPDSTVAT